VPTSPRWHSVLVIEADDARTVSGQVAQVVERSPEKAGVGGSTPSLATIILKNLFELPCASPVRS
jgi:hypothetical protein